MVGPKSHLEGAIDLLQELGVFHIESSPATPEERQLSRFLLGPDLEKSKRVMEEWAKELNQLILALPKRETPEGPVEEFRQWEVFNPDDWVALEKIISTAKTEIEPVLKRLRDVEEESHLYEKYQRILEAIVPLLQQVRESRDLEFLGFILEAEEETVLGKIRETLSELTEGQYELFFSRVDSKQFSGLLVVPKKILPRVRSSLWQENFSELRLPSSLSGLPLLQALKILIKRRVENPVEMQNVQNRLGDLSVQWRDRLELYKKSIENGLSQLESTHFFYQTQFTFLLFGWVPENEFLPLADKFMNAFHGSVVVEREEVVKAEIPNIPVALKNPHWIKPFEFFTRLVSLPRYGSIDPTPFLAFFVPLFFGMILGDIGYGILLLGFSLFARKKWGAFSSVRDFSSVFIISSISAIIFGVLYGEFFGNLGEKIGIHPILVNRLEGFVLLLQMTLGVGLIHVLLGMILGLITAVRHRGFHETLTKSSGLIFLLSGILCVGSLLEILPKPLGKPLGILSLVSLVSLILFGGFRGTMELHNHARFSCSKAKASSWAFLITAWALF